MSESQIDELVELVHSLNTRIQTIVGRLDIRYSQEGLAPTYNNEEPSGTLSRSRSMS